MRAGQRGFTLIELLISMTVLAILGAAAMRTIGSSARLNEKQEASQRARAVARGSAARMSHELRSVPQPWPGSPEPTVEIAVADSVQARVPYAMALFCDLQGGLATFSVLPRDTVISAFADHAGLLVRLGPGVLEWYATIAPVAGTASRCTAGPGIQTLTGGTVVQVPAAPGSPLATRLATVRPGQTVHFARRVRYVFRRGARTSLARVVLDGAGAVRSDEEIASPFHSMSRFTYWLHTNPTPGIPTLAERSEVVGVTAILASLTDERVREGDPAAAGFGTTIMFQNVPR